MNVLGAANQASSVSVGAALNPAEAAKTREQTKRQLRRQFDAQARLAANTEAQHSLLDELAP